MYSTAAKNFLSNLVTFLFDLNNYWNGTRLEVWSHSGADLGISRGGDFQKNFKNFVDLFFLNRPNWFSEVLQITIKTPIWPSFPRRMQIFEKRSKTAFLGTFWKMLTKKSRFFGARSPFKTSIFWRLFFLTPHLTQASILWSKGWFYKFDYEDQICLPWSN